MFKKIYEVIDTVIKGINNFFNRIIFELAQFFKPYPMIGSWSYRFQVYVAKIKEQNHQDDIIENTRYEVWRNQLGALELYPGIGDNHFGFGSIKLGVFWSKKAAESFITRVEKHNIMTPQKEADNDGTVIENELYPVQRHPGNTVYWYNDPHIIQQPIIHNKPDIGVDPAKPSTDTSDPSD